MDQQGLEDPNALPPGSVNTVARMSERVAAIEGRFTAEIGALKEDTRTIRSSIHDINNNLQLTVAAERQCALALAQISEKMVGQAEQVNLRMMGLTEQLTTLASDVKALIAAKQFVEGSWWASLKLGSILMGAASVVGAAAGAVWWALQHVKIAP